MGILGALWERFHPVNRAKAQETAEAAFAFYLQIEKDHPKVRNGLRVFISCFLALKAVKADGDQVVPNHQLAAVATFPEEGKYNDIIAAATAIALCRGHMRNMGKQDLLEMATGYRDNVMPAIKDNYSRNGLQSNLFAVYLSSQQEIADMINKWNV